MTIQTPGSSTSSADYSAIVKVTPFTQILSTEALFDKSHKLSKLSPIDEFIENANKLNLLWINQDEISSEFASILFLGYFSAVESYVRALVRTLIQTDIYSQKCAENQQITFGAALHHNKQLLPEALMDNHSFTASENILKTFKSLTDIELVIDEAITTELDKICQLRHCCVHRFGKLGAKNAMALGLTSHSKLFEKPLTLSRDDLLLVSSTLRSVVKTINNAAYKAVLDRTFPTVPVGKGDKKRLPKSLWSKDYEADKELFIKYYKVFSSTNKDESPKMKEMYTRFIAEKEQALQKISKGAAKKPNIPQGQGDANGHPQGDTSHQQENNAVDVPQEQVAQEGAK
ncbi:MULTISPECIES: hypothetical protein [Pseudomonas]|uniref:hypothetical protein n=1 Tax=Pseudomonas TaxID=286 RepID=UPI000B191C27|nr:MULTISPECIES: hypothetical protein [Pseudomonas]MBO8339334.1 hypothetical protein [Pseudomonas aeruginosa]RTR76437.1 hypothetical protein DY934_23985 [Pseudomonas aeruginosa]UCM26307.1 hypothetical protein LE197_25620 [Pseudomonas sp. PS1(2021)]SQC50407.1 Uncharacterised protein [Pseudomonas aeruginosa]HBO3166464.1 hypothetical protein [Pseudomonas aeruginosa]